jgi:hypothetical protein
MYKPIVLLSFVVLAVCGHAIHAAETATGASATSAMGLELTLGTVKDQVESAAVRALVKYGDRVSEDDRLSNASKPVFFEVTRKVQFDVTDKGAFGGVALRYGAKAYKVPFGERMLPNGRTALVSDSNGWMHVFPVTVGVDADRNFKNLDVLLEAGYVPFKGDSGASCFKLGGNPAVGLSGQLGHRNRDPATAKPDEKSTLKRVKLEVLADFKLGCFRSKSPNASDGGVAEEDSLLTMFAKDLYEVRILVEGRAWRDFDLKDNFRYAALTVRVPVGKGMFMDFKREVGSEAPTFAKGSQFGAYLTVQF